MNSPLIFATALYKTLFYKMEAGWGTISQSVYVADRQQHGELNSAFSHFQNQAQAHRLCYFDFRSFERNHIYKTVALRLLFKNLKEYCEIPS